MKHFLILLSSLLVGSCTTLKTIKIIKSGHVKQKKYVVEMPFEYRLGLIVFKVKIEGNYYSFILDTGATNVISTELAAKLNLISKTKHKVGDSQGNSSDLGLVTIKNINIGGVDFKNTGAVIADLTSSNEISCMKVDGIIGSNLMKKAIWKFDYQHQTITITHSIKSLYTDTVIEKIPFETNFIGAPLCKIKVDNHVQKNVTIDLGSNGDVSLSNSLFDSIISKNKGCKTLSSYGHSSSGLYGFGDQDTINFLVCEDISFGDIQLKNQIIEFTNNSAVTIGTNFFKNYDLIINWFEKEIKLIKKKTYDYSSIEDFGCTWMYIDGNLKIKSLTTGGPAELSGIKLNDHIIEINKVSYKDIPIENWCEIIDGAKNILNKNELDILIMRNNELLRFVIKKKKQL